MTTSVPDAPVEVKPIQGNCLCGAVKYVVNKPALYQLICCCTECQRVGGSFGQASLICVRTEVSVVDGAGKITAHNFDGETLVRQFCSKCGTHLFAGKEGDAMLAVHAGTLADPGLFKPQIGIHCKNKRGFWSLGELPCFNEYPPPQK